LQKERETRTVKATENDLNHALMTAARAKALWEQAGDYQLHFHRCSLWQGDVDQALQGLRALSSGLPAEALKPLEKAIRYLENQRPWIGSYERWKAQGYPVGSAMIERAVAIVINRRDARSEVCVGADPMPPPLSPAG
jgi:hypothetical protein